MKFSQQVQDSSLQIHNNPKCPEKLVIFMYDNGWNTQLTEFDIVEEGDCSIVDVTSTHEKPRIPIRTYSRESLFVLCTYWNEKKGLEDSHEYSSHS